MASNPSAIRMPPLPTEPLPINALRTGLLYMYTCSQCDFKTHIESMFKQHVDYFHLGISRVSKSNPVFARASAPAGQSNPVVMAASPTASLGSQRLSAAAIAQLASVAAEQNQHKCLKCDFEATTKHKLNQHKRKNHGKNVPPSGAPQFEQTIVAAKVLRRAQPQTSPQASGQTEPQIIAVQKMFTCQVCGYATARRDGLSQHFDSVHLKIKNRQCYLCPYAASQKGTLNRHIRLKHKTEPPMRPKVKI